MQKQKSFATAFLQEGCRSPFFVLRKKHESNQEKNKTGKASYLTTGGLMAMEVAQNRENNMIKHHHHFGNQPNIKTKQHLKHATKQQNQGPLLWKQGKSSQTKPSVAMIAS